MRCAVSLFFITSICMTQCYSENFSCEALQKNGQLASISENLTDPSLNGLSITDKENYANTALGIIICPKMGYSNKPVLVAPAGIRSSSNVKQTQLVQNINCKLKCTLILP